MPGDEVKVDGRKADDIYEWLAGAAPYYVPELDPSDETGSAFLKIFSHMAEDVTRRLDQVPEKHLMAFFDTLGFSLNPPQPARVPLKFVVSGGAAENVYVPEGTRATADAKPEHPELTYEVERGWGFVATPSALTKVYSADPARDVIIDHLANGGSSPELFAGSPNVQKHVLYIGHADLFNIKGKAVLEVVVEPAGLDPSSLAWEYYGETIEDGKKVGGDGWKPLKGGQPLDDGMAVVNVRGIGPTFNGRLNAAGVYTVGQLLRLEPGRLAYILHTSARIAADITESAEKALWDAVTAPPVKPSASAEARAGHFILYKDVEGEVKEYEVAPDKLKSRWIRCTYSGKDFSSVVGSVKVAVGPYQPGGSGGVKPDMALHNDVPLDLDKLPATAVRPLGESTNLYDSFYIACNDVFSKKGSTIEIKFYITGSTASSPALSWEYWNGKGWDVIGGLSDNTNSLQNIGTNTVSFPCPVDLDKVKVGGHENLWIRARLVGGDYGKPIFKPDTSGNWTMDTTSVQPPRLNGITISYRYPASALPAERLVAYNNLDYSGDRAGTAFKPFEGLADAGQCVYMGFTKRLTGGPINVLFLLEGREYPEGFMPRVRWEYRSAEGWARLQASDGTENLTLRGILSMVVPVGMVEAKAFGDALFWVRGTLVSEQFEPRPEAATHKEKEKGRYGEQPCEKALSVDCPGAGKYPPALKGIHLNATWASQAETIKDELLGSSEGTAGQGYVFSRRPALEAEVWVDEITAVTAAERKGLAAAMPGGVRQTSDADGNLTGFWVKWGMVGDFLSSGPGDRHYLLEPSTGQVTFGDGIYGMIPPKGKDNIKASYRTGGGTGGNVKAGEVASLKTSLAFIEGALNPEAADGGMGLETDEQLRHRAPQRLKNRGRAVTKEDFERIALDASRKISRARCIPNLNGQCKRERGWVTLIIVPEGGDDRPAPSEELKRQVMAYVRGRSPMVLMPRKVIVRGPAYLEVSVRATLVSADVSAVPAIEAGAYARLKKFLHPLTGGEDGGGWEFGRLPCLSDLYRLFEGIPGVDHVKELTMEVKGIKGGQKILLTPNSDQQYQVDPLCLACGGIHDISVTYEVPEDDD